VPAQGPYCCCERYRARDFNHVRLLYYIRSVFALVCHMCELFGLSASQPLTVRQELEQFRLRGGFAADNPDGWGLAWRENEAFHLAKEPQAAHCSAGFKILCETTRSSLVIAHVRKARFPPINTLNNTHPFQHLCCGKAWVFAHNGLVPDVVEMAQENDGSICRPAGETDSEYAFCHLLGHLSRIFHHSGLADIVTSFQALAQALAGMSEIIASRGKFNFLMSDGEHLMAYGHDRLHYLELSDASAESAMIATEPLAGVDGWIPFEPGELRIYCSGRKVGRILTRPSDRMLDPQSTPA